jgi:hypothetical protein
LRNENKKFLIGFFNPNLSGVYVFIGVLSTIFFGIYYFGYGCWLREGAFFLVPAVCVLILIITLTAWLQTRIWNLLSKQPETNKITLSEMLTWAGIVAFIIIPLCVGVGAKICEVRADRVCRDCDVLITDLENGKKLQGIYPTNAPVMVKANSVLRRKYFFYYGHTDANGINWDPSEIAEANVSFFITTNHFQIVVPIEKMSPISFSSFYVYSYFSDHPFWNKTKLHWSLMGSYIDDPGQ